MALFACTMFSAATRNLAPIQEVLTQYLKAPCPPSSPSPPPLLLEVSSGDATHVLHLSEQFGDITFQPSELQLDQVDHINRRCQEEAPGRKNLLSAVTLDVSQPLSEAVAPPDSLHFLLNVNMVHISPWKCSEGLFKAAGTALRQGGRLFTYGPYAQDGRLTPESNRKFDQSLKSRNPSWGIRDLRDLSSEAEKNGLGLEKVHEMPANNKLCVWLKK